MKCARAHVAVQLATVMSLDLKLAFLSFLSCLTVLIVLESLISPSKLQVHPKLSSSIALTSPAIGIGIGGAKYTAAESTQSRHEGVNQASFRSERNSKNALIKPATPIHPMKHVSFKILRPVNWHPISTVDPYHVIPDQQKNVSAVAKSIYFSIKTTQRNHATRLPVLLLTWMQKVHANQVSASLHSYLLMP